MNSKKGIFLVIRKIKVKFGTLSDGTTNFISFGEFLDGKIDCTMLQAPFVTSSHAKNIDKYAIPLKVL